MRLGGFTIAGENLREGRLEESALQGSLNRPDWCNGFRPRILRGLNTVSTDDAYVNSHVTFVAARVSR
jgi:hypothetical protein